MTILYSRQSQRTDFITLKGIRTEIGLGKDDLDDFIIRELLDNALDYIESNAKEFVKLEKDPFVELIITEEIKDKVTKVTVRNSHTGKDHEIFPNEVVQKIFDFNDYMSSKRNRYNIGRGALGGAFKHILGIPYALAVEYSSDYTDYEDWKYPLQINVSNKKLIEVRLEITDKIKKTIQPKIDIKDIESEDEEEEYTEVTVYIPKKLNYRYIHDFVFERYALLNTHINFKIDIPEYSEYEYEATQSIRGWKNNQSIYYFSLNEFKDLIRGFEDSSDSLNVYDELILDFREGWKIQKEGTEFETLTFGQLKHDNSKIEKIYYLLKEKVRPIREQSSSLSKLELPFEMKQEIRKEALEERFEEILDIESFAYKRINGYYGPKGDNPVEFPFIVEIILVETIHYHKCLHICPYGNLSPFIHYNAFDDTDRDKFIYSWMNDKKEWEFSHSITEILYKLNYNYDEKKHKKSTNLVFINLISPRIEYKQGGKTELELKPFGSMGHEFYKFCKSSKSNKSRSESGETKKGLLRGLLEKRLNDVKNNPELLTTERWTQSTVFYTLRPILIEKNLLDKKTRGYITGLIAEECERLGNEIRNKPFKRHELGIIAAERSQLFFDGEVLGISFDRLEKLMDKGTDIIVIEKEGVADQLAPFAQKLGIAILNSRGFLTEYADELSKLAEKKGCNIVVLTDWDSSGLLIASKLENSYRIGIDSQTLEKWGLKKEQVEEKVIQEKKDDKHLTNLQKLQKLDYKTPKPYTLTEWRQMIKYLDGRKRIEIDSVIAKIGPQKLWEYIIERLGAKFKTRYYNRSIKVPQFVLPKTIEGLIQKINDMFANLQSDEREIIIQQLATTEGFIKDIEVKKQHINDRLISSTDGDIADIKEFLHNEIAKL